MLLVSLLDHNECSKEPKGYKKFTAVSPFDMIAISNEGAFPTPKKEKNMDDILTVSQLIDELREFPPDAAVMITVVKYPDEFKLRPPTDANDGEPSWDLGTDVECHPLEVGEITLQQGLVYLTVELADYDEARRTVLGS